MFIVSFGTFKAIAVMLGGRCASTRTTEDAGLDIAEHGMYGYPEQFIPAPELIGYSVARPVDRGGAGPDGPKRHRHADREVTSS